MSYHLKLGLRRASVSKLTKYEFLEKHGFIPETEAVVWPESIFDVCDFAANIDCIAGMIDINKILSKGTISLSKLTGKREAPKNISRCVLLVNRDCEPIYVNRSRSGRIYEISTRSADYYTDFVGLKCILLNINNLTDTVPAVVSKEVANN